MAEPRRRPARRPASIHKEKTHERWPFRAGIEGEMPDKRLRSVGPDGAPKPQRPKSLIEAAETGDNVALCKALRSRLVEAIRDHRTRAHALAPLARQVGHLTEQLDRFEQKRQNEATDAQAPGDESWDQGAI
jgi:hypothetical protein